MMHDDHIRSFYRPADHTLRDWQHILTSGGVANRQCAQVIKRLIARGTPLGTLQNFLETFQMPARHGKTDGVWLSKNDSGKQ